MGRQCPPTPGPGLKRMNRRLGGRSIDGRPGVNPQFVSEDRQFVDQGDIDVPERVLQQLGQLGFLARGGRHGVLHQCPVEAVHRAQRVPVDAGDDLGGVLQAPDRVARVDPLGAVARWKSRPAVSRSPSRARVPALPRSCPGMWWTPARRWRPAADVQPAFHQLPRCRRGRALRRAAGSAR